MPQECLILTMQHNQKYFPLFDAGGRLAQFLLVSNMRPMTRRPSSRATNGWCARGWPMRGSSRSGPKTRLDARVAQLAKVVYHNKLGTQLQRVERLRELAAQIAA